MRTDTDGLLAARFAATRDDRDDSDWNDVLRRRQQGRLQPPRALVIALAVAVIAVLSAIALATSNGWWFQHKTPFSRLGVKPVTGVPSIIATGRVDGQRWTAVAYVSKLPGRIRVGAALHPVPGTAVCLSVIFGELSNVPGGTGCGMLRGMPLVSPKEAGSWITYLHTGKPSIITGAVAKGVAHLTLVLFSSKPGRSKTIDIPLKQVSSVSWGIRVFALPYPVGGIESLNAYDSGGKLLQRLG